MPRRLVLALLLATPAIADDLPPGDPEFGAELFQSLCITCHHEDARGDDRAPDIRGATVPAIRRGTSGMDSMQDFHFEAQEVADLHAYLATLIE